MAFFISPEQTEYTAIAYYRLSKDDGKKQSESDSISNQRKLIHAYIAAHPNIRLIGEENDDGYTGTNFERPGFNRVLDRIRSKEANCVIVKDLSRLGREYIEMGKYLEMVFPSLGVRFIAVNDDVDSEHQRSGDDIVIPIKNIMNESYCRELSQKLRKQFRIQRGNGEFLGAFACYGYRKSPSNKHQLVIDSYAAEVVRGIFSLKLKGYSQQAIADTLNREGILSPSEYKRSQGLNYQSGLKGAGVSQWSAVSIRSVLTNPIYIGTLIQGKRGTPNYKVKKMYLRDQSQWITVEHNHPPIIEESLFTVVQQMLQRDTRTSPAEDTVYPLSGVLYCADCGRAMCRRSVSRNGKKFFYYVCSDYKHNLGCTSHSIPQEQLERAVLHAVEMQIRTVAELDQLYQKTNHDRILQTKVTRLDLLIAQKQREIEEYNEFRMRLYESLTDGIIDRSEYDQMRLKYTHQIESARNAVARLEAEKDCAASGTISDRSWIDQFAKYQGLQQLCREAVVTLIDRISVYEDKRIHIDFNYRNELEKEQSVLEQASKEVV